MKPTPAPARYSEHRTMAEVMADERRGCRCHLPRYYGHVANCALAGPVDYDLRLLHRTRRKAG